MTANEPELIAPLEPGSLEGTGLPESLVEHLILKILYFRGELYGQDLSQAIGLKFSVIQELVETLKLQHLLQVKRSIGMGNVGAVFALTESGRVRTREYLEANQYSGAAGAIRRAGEAAAPQGGLAHQGGSAAGVSRHGDHRTGPVAGWPGGQFGQFHADLRKTGRRQDVPD
jgi:hypothetical protein